MTQNCFQTNEIYNFNTAIISYIFTSDRDKTAGDLCCYIPNRRPEVEHICLIDGLNRQNEHLIS